MEHYLTNCGKDSITLDDKQVESIDFALKNISDRVNIIFVCKIARDDKKKPDSRKKIYKTLSKYSQVKEFAQFRNFDKTLLSIIAAIAKEKGLQTDTVSSQKIINQLGVNLNLINSELEKLAIAIHPEKKVTAAHIEKYCTSTDDIFTLADLIIKGNKNEVMKQYNLLAEKRHYLEIFAFLQNNMQKFIFIKNYERKMSSKDMAAKLRPLTEGVIENIKRTLRTTSLDRLVQIRENLINAEYKIKTGKTAIAETALELALLS